MSSNLNRLFRIAVLPLLIAAPMVVAGLSPARFFSDGRCITALALLVIGLAFENAIVDPESVRASKESAGLDRGSFELSLVTNICCIYLPVYEYLNLPPLIPRTTATLVAGLALIAAGEGLRVAALRTLGRFFTMRVAVLEGHRVVREGLYKFVRHPAYTGWFLLFLGFAVFFDSVIGIVGTSAFVVVLGWRVNVEEAALCRLLGDDYRSYMRDVRRRFIPGVF